jgi:hypothetical protein
MSRYEVQSNKLKSGSPLGIDKADELLHVLFIAVFFYTIHKFSYLFRIDNFGCPISKSLVSPVEGCRVIN